MWTMSELSVLTRILEITPLFLSVPTAYILLRVYGQTKRKLGHEAAFPFLILAVFIGTAFITQVAWFAALIHIQPGISFAVFTFGRLLRSLAIMIGCLSLAKVWTDLVLRGK